jgi:hypothetical protein
VSKAFLTVILGAADLPAQREHLARGALFLPEPEPPPEPFAEIVLRVETPSGASLELDGRVLQILTGRAIAVAFDDAAAARAKLAPLFAETPPEGDATPTVIYWGRPEATPAAPDPAATAAAPPEPEPEAGEDRDEAAKLRDQLATMTTNQKMQLALKGDRLARLLLLKEPNKSFQAFVLQNPRLTIEEVRFIAGFRQATPDVLLAIAANRDWVGNAAIVSALVRNPKTPGPTAVKLMDKLPMAEIRRLAKSSDTPTAVQTAARRKVATEAK